MPLNPVQLTIKTLSLFLCQGMESHNQPSKIARLTDHEMKSVTQSGVGVSLGIGGGCGQRQGCSKSNGFTFLQLRELEHQTLIYNYIEAGLPVPFHLILPVWKSVATSPSFTGLNFQGCSSLYYDYKNSMEPEPGRCRRTDGKKWRCSKDVVLNHKYCERHINRGRRRQ